MLLDVAFRGEDDSGGKTLDEAHAGRGVLGLGTGFTVTKQSVRLGQAAVQQPSQTLRADEMGEIDGRQELGAQLVCGLTSLESLTQASPAGLGERT